MKNIEIIDFKHFACLKYKVSDEILEQLKYEADYIIKNEDLFKKYNKELVGNLEKEYSLDKSKEILTPILNNLAKKYYKHKAEENETYSKWSVDTLIDGIWINFQKKYEYNPLHNHTGDLSFVLWVQIPYDLEKELSLPNCKNSVAPSNSLFEFVFTDFLGKIVTTKIYVDKSWEGTLVLFPSSLNHIVYPFYTSDDYRISISGNLIVTPEKNIFSYQ